MWNVLFRFANDFENVDEVYNEREVYGVKKVIFNNPATIVIWKDGTKTVVKATDGDTFDEEVGFAMALAKKIYGSRSHYMKHIIGKAVRPSQIQLKEKKK